MKIAGIIAEYNPFHNGHAYQIRQVRKITEADYIIVVMSGDFVQRGEPAMADKYLRTEMALQNGADVVLELPVLFSCAGAEYFSRGGVSVLDDLGCVTHLCFGTEQKNLDAFLPVINILEEEPEAYRELLQSFLKNGCGFPASRTNALEKYLNMDVSFLRQPNNILALEYLRALKKKNSSILPVGIQRIGAGYHNCDIKESYASASAIRNALRTSVSDPEYMKEQLRDSMPDTSLSLLYNYMKKYPLLSLEDFSFMLHYCLLQFESADEISGFFDIDTFLANRIFQKRFSFQDVSSFTELLLSKNQTRFHIQRSLLHLLLNIRQPENNSSLFPAYARILGMKRESSKVVRIIRDSSCIPVIGKMADADKDISSFNMEETRKASAFFQLKQSTFAAHLYESVLSQKSSQDFRHEKTRQIVII